MGAIQEERSKEAPGHVLSRKDEGGGLPVGTPKEWVFKWPTPGTACLSWFSGACWWPSKRNVLASECLLV